MTVSYVAASGFGAITGAGAGNSTFSYNSTSGDALWVAACENGGSTITGVTFNGIALTQIAGPASDAGSFTSGSVWVLTATGGLGGTHNVIVSYSSGTHVLTVMAWLTTGTHQTIPAGTAVTNTASPGGTSSANLNSVLGDSNGIFLDVLIANNEATAPTGFSGGNGQTQIDASPTANSVHQTLVVGRKAGAASTTLGGWTWVTSSHYSELGFGVNAASIGAPPISLLYHRKNVLYFI